ncbi:hypothetical protein BRADO0262 [Bradyrhizobium sp. ORS 278]|uniref:hypothetical protein n=1 Tax=Bradyrhizobium sp. (strain ORS 278) TaxID=114615 RepID=UPI0001507BC1|nr:hypothetical protein [Bradyrhizobium sp. ORS 278]CAL74222.1 hypothetical protein BRADO0262 [Bradyrhizobium sp. ORS 278]
MTLPEQPAQPAPWGCLRVIVSILLLLIGLVLLAPGLLCLVSVRNTPGLFAVFALGAIVLGLFLVLAAIRLMRPCRHGR